MNDGTGSEQLPPAVAGESGLPGEPEVVLTRDYYQLLKKYGLSVGATLDPDCWSVTTQPEL